MGSIGSFAPQARRTALTVQNIGDEVLVFDAANETAHALNKPAAFVWQNADGTRTVEQLARDMTCEFGTPADVQVVWYALEQLSKKQLLESPMAMPTAGMTRRQFLKRATAGAVLLAVVTSIVAPTPAHAQSGCTGLGGTCVTTEECCGTLQCCVGVGPTCEIGC